MLTNNFTACCSMKLNSTGFCVPTPSKNDLFFGAPKIFDFLGERNQLMPRGLQMHIRTMIGVVSYD